MMPLCTWGHPGRPHRCRCKPSPCLGPVPHVLTWRKAEAKGQGYSLRVWALYQVRAHGCVIGGDAGGLATRRGLQKGQGLRAWGIHGRWGEHSVDH